MTSVINYLRGPQDRRHQGIYVCTDWYDNELSYYLGFWPRETERMERSLEEEIGDYLEFAASALPQGGGQGEISISGIIDGKSFAEDWSAGEITDPEKVLLRIMDLVRKCSNPKNLPWKRIKEQEDRLRKADYQYGSILLFGIRAWYYADTASERQWDLQYLVEVDS